MNDLINRIDLRYDWVKDTLSRHKIADSGCWEWEGYVNDRGYGQFKIYVNHLRPQKRTFAAHRVSYAFHHGVDPAEMYVCHTCDNPCCINPDHLFLGSPAENSADMVRKGRSLAQAGSRNHASKLTEEVVLDVVAKIKQGLNNKQIAESLPVSHSSVSLIRLGKVWRETLDAANYDPSDYRVFTRRKSA